MSRCCDTLPYLGVGISCVEDFHEDVALTLTGPAPEQQHMLLEGRGRLQLRQCKECFFGITLPAADRQQDLCDARMLQGHQKAV